MLISLRNTKGIKIHKIKNKEKITKTGDITVLIKTNFVQIYVGVWKLDKTAAPRKWLSIKKICQCNLPY